MKIFYIVLHHFGKFPVFTFFTNDANCKEVLDQYATVAYGYDTFTTFGLGIMLTSRQTVLSGPVFCRQHGTADMMQSYECACSLLVSTMIAATFDRWSCRTRR